MTPLPRAALLLAAVACACADPAPPAKQAPASAAAPVEISMVTSTQKRQWLETGLSRFRVEHPDIRVLVRFAGSNEEIRAIVEGADKPTVFSPNEGALLAELASQARARGGREIFAAHGEDAPRSILRTPYVFLGNDKVVGRLIAASPTGHLTFSAVLAEVRRRRAAHLPALRYGFVDLAKGSSGLNAMLLMGLELNGAPRLTAEQARDAGLASRIRELDAAAVYRFPTTSALAARLSRPGSEVPDLVFTYESTAIELLRALVDRDEQQPLRLYYPDYTLESDQPAVVLKGDWVTPAQREAALVWLDFLQGPIMQREAVRLGLRPNDPALLDVDSGIFAQVKSLGFRRDLPPTAPKPDEAVTRALVAIAQESLPSATASR